VVALTQKQWVEAGWVADLTNGITWDNMQPWAKESATLPGPDGKPGTYFVVEYATTTEIYYNKQLFTEAGITVPANGQFSEDEFRDALKKITGKGAAGFANANGDRDYPGAIPLLQIMLAKLGPEDIVKLWKGEIPWTDPRVVASFEYFESLVKEKAFPATFSSMTLSESHNYFHTQRKAGMFAVPSWYTARAFVPTEKGGQPKDFQLGFLAYPGMKDGKGLKSKYLEAGGAHTVAAKSKNRDQAIKVLNGLTDPAWAAEWVGTTGNLTAAKIDPKTIKSEFQDYWTEYFKAQEGYTAVANLGHAIHAKPAQIEVWTAVASQGLPAGLVTAKDAIAKLDDGWKKGAS
jgi:ABC-type glycerol-3-phosphate transport system substrate-binding protein